MANRVAEIRETSSPSQWHHVPSDENPADIISRGTSEFQEISKQGEKMSWKFGPNFLRYDEEQWPSFDIQPLDKEGAEIRTKTVLSTTVEAEEPILDPKNYSSFNKLMRVVSWANVKTTKSTYLLPKELDEAKLVISHIAQSQFVEEIDCLKNRKPVSNKSRLVSLKPFIDDNGIIGVGGRLKNANIPYNAKHQIILPNNHISQLIIQKLHIENGHGGTNQLLADTRQIYWILNGRVAVKKVIRSCIHCQKANQSHKSQ